MGLFHSLKEYFKSSAKNVEGKLSEATDKISRNPDAVGSKYDDVIRDKIKGVKDYRTALAGLITQKDAMLDKAKSLTKDVSRLEDIKAGAAAKVKQLVGQLKSEGKSGQEIQAHPEYTDGHQAYTRFSKELEKKEDEIVDLETRAEELDGKITSHKSQLKTLIDNIEDLKKEAEEAKAELAAGSDLADARDMLDATAGSGGNSELQNLREIRAKAKAEARISKELGAEVSGSSVDDMAKEFLESAEASNVEDEFAAMVGLGPASSSTVNDAVKGAAATVTGTAASAASGSDDDAKEDDEGGDAKKPGLSLPE